MADQIKEEDYTTLQADKALRDRIRAIVLTSELIGKRVTMRSFVHDNLLPAVEAAEQELGITRRNSYEAGVASDR